jgi:hypothetical protein
MSHTTSFLDRHHLPLTVLTWPVGLLGVKDSQAR